MLRGTMQNLTVESDDPKSNPDEKLRSILIRFSDSASSGRYGDLPVDVIEFLRDGFQRYLRGEVKSLDKAFSSAGKSKRRGAPVDFEKVRAIAAKLILCREEIPRKALCDNNVTRKLRAQKIKAIAEELGTSTEQVKHVDDLAWEFISKERHEIYSLRAKPASKETLDAIVEGISDAISQEIDEG